MEIKNSDTASRVTKIQYYKREFENSSSTPIKHTFVNSFASSDGKKPRKDQKPTSEAMGIKKEPLQLPQNDDNNNSAKVQVKKYCIRFSQPRKMIA